MFNKVRVRTDTSIHVRIMPSQFQALLSPLGGICHLVDPGDGDSVTKPLPGDEAFVNSSRRGQRRSFFKTSLKNMNIQIALAISINNIFNTVLCFKKICVVFTPSLPYPTVCFASVPPS